MGSQGARPIGIFYGYSAELTKKAALTNLLGKYKNYSLAFSRALLDPCIKRCWKYLDGGWGSPAKLACNLSLGV
jgi:hypothetical protein